MFWLGWMVFIFALLNPVLGDHLSAPTRKILDPLKKRIRNVVFWMIWILIGTGAVNVYFTGLYRTEILLETASGHQFLVKLGAALLLFLAYALIP